MTSIRKYIDILSEDSTDRAIHKISSNMDSMIDDFVGDELSTKQLLHLSNKVAAEISTEHGFSLIDARKLVDRYVDQKLIEPPISEGVIDDLTAGVVKLGRKYLDTDTAKKSIAGLSAKDAAEFVAKSVALDAITGSDEGNI
jgi:hypothetical protein